MRRTFKQQCRYDEMRRDYIHEGGKVRMCKMYESGLEELGLECSGWNGKKIRARMKVLKELKEKEMGVTNESKG